MATELTKKPLTGTFLRPGVSLNKRLYTKEMIGKAVARMQARIADPDGLPIGMRSFHGAGDDSRLIVGRITAARQEPDGRATYEARWYDTAPARDIAALVYPADGGPPGLRSVSIHGWFIGEHKVEHDGEQVTTADDLEVDFIDFTASPGVVTALIDPPSASRPSESAAYASGRIPISETWEARVAETDTSAPAAAADEYSAAQKRDMAANGQAMVDGDGSISYPVKTKGDLRKAIRAVGRGGADHDAIRKHVIARAAALGLTSMIPDSWNADGSLKESATRFGPVHECYPDGPGGAAGFAIDAYNGPVSLTLRAPSIHPSGLRAIATAAITAALDALGALDPDMDADIDVPGAPEDDSDGDQGAGEAAPGDPSAATGDDDNEDDAAQPGGLCPCAHGCAVPEDPAAGSGCPCACGCETCGAPTREESAPPPADPPAAESAPPEAHIETPAPAPAPAPETTAEESAVSETETPAAEAATPAPAPQPPAAQPMIALTQEQFNTLLGALRPAPAAESATTAAVPAAAEPPAPAAAPAAPIAPPQGAAPAAPTSEAATRGDIASAVAEALKAAIPALRDSIVSEYGLPPRRGVRTSETDGNAAEMTADQLWDNRADILLGNLGKVG